jgi:hypothetical protein
VVGVDHAQFEQVRGVVALAGRVRTGRQALHLVPAPADGT